MHHCKPETLLPGQETHGGKRDGPTSAMTAPGSDLPIRDGPQEPRLTLHETEGRKESGSITCGH